jgi:hypothetical protein
LKSCNPIEILEKGELHACDCSLEDLKSARKEGVSIYAMLYLSSKAETTATEDALCSMLYGNGAG